MKKFIHPTLLPVLTLGAGLVGMALRFWHLSSISGDGLLPLWHPAGVLSGLVATAAVVCLFISTRALKGQVRYRANFPASPFAAVCCCAAGLAMFLRALGLLMDGSVSMMTPAGVTGVIATPCLILTGMNRWKGARSSFLLHLLLCLAFGCQLMLHYQVWTASPVLQLHFYRMLSIAGLMLTSFHRTEFDVNMANRRRYAFISLCTMLFCLLAIPEGDGLFYLCMAAWVFGNLCSMTNPRQRAGAENAASEVQPAPEESHPAGETPQEEA